MKNKRISAALLALFLLTALFTGCAAKSAPMEAADYVSAAKAEYDYEEPAAEEYAMPEPEAPMATAATEDYMEGGGEINKETLEAFTSKIIYSASVSVQTTEFDSAVAALEKMVTDFGGFVENSNVSGNTCYDSDGSVRIINRWGYYTVRIPAARFEEFLRQSDGLGNVISTSRDAQNVTSQYTDFEARLESLNTQEDRLLEMLKKSEDIESLIALEQRLSDVRYEIESIQRNLRNLDQQISYSTVNLELQEVEKYTPVVPVRRTFGQRIADAVKNGWSNFVSGLGNLCVILVEALPTLLLIAAVIVAVVLLIRRSVKKRRAKKAARKAEQSEPETKE